MLYAVAMNPLAAELNKQLAGTVAEALLSKLGRSLFFPRGIVAQTAEASGRATRYNATVGMAKAGGEALTTELMRELVLPLSPGESVAYAPTPGLPALRDTWKQEIRSKNPSLGEFPFRPLVVPGLTHGIYQLASLFVDQGDQILVPDLFWGNYRLMLETRFGARLQPFPFFTADGGFDLAALDAALSRFTAKAILLLNTPNNPSGYSLTRSEATDLASLLKAHAERGCRLLVLSDDAYFGLVYEDGIYAESLFALIADLHPNILAAKVDGATKEDFAWGLRVGFVTLAAQSLPESACRALEQKMAGGIRSVVSNAPMISQQLVLRLYRDPAYAQQKQALAETLRERYAAVQAQLSGHGIPRSPFPDPDGGLTALPHNSGYFMSLRLGRPVAEQLRQALLDSGIGTISIGDDILRIAFASVDADEIPGLYRAIVSHYQNLR